MKKLILFLSIAIISFTTSAASKVGTLGTMEDEKIDVYESVKIDYSGGGAAMVKYFDEHNAPQKIKLSKVKWLMSDNVLYYVLPTKAKQYFLSKVLAISKDRILIFYDQSYSVIDMNWKFVEQINIVGFGKNATKGIQKMKDYFPGCTEMHKKMDDGLAIRSLPETSLDCETCDNDISKEDLIKLFNKLYAEKKGK
jgi:hypothetical protein